MNYSSYQEKIIEKYGVELTGWPIHGHICNPGQLSTDDNIILLKALVDGKCKWRKLMQGEVSAQKLSNKQSDMNGGTVNELPQQPCTQQLHVIDSEMQVDDYVVDKNTA
jgi:hypothetical protein